MVESIACALGGIVLAHQNTSTRQGWPIPASLHLLSAQHRWNSGCHTSSHTSCMYMSYNQPNMLPVHSPRYRLLCTGPGGHAPARAVFVAMRWRRRSACTCFPELFPRSSHSLQQYSNESTAASTAEACSGKSWAGLWQPVADNYSQFPANATNNSQAPPQGAKRKNERKDSLYDSQTSYGLLSTCTCTPSGPLRGRYARLCACACQYRRLSR